MSEYSRLVIELALHDATLRTLSFDWKQGALELLIKTATGFLTLRATDVKQLSCPRQHPWGPSAHINDARSIKGENGRGTLELEMQSGDVIVIEAASFTAAES